MASAVSKIMPLFMRDEGDIVEQVPENAQVTWFKGFRDEDCVVPGKTVAEVREEKIAAMLKKYESAKSGGASHEEADAQARAVLESWAPEGLATATVTAKKRKHKKSKKASTSQPVNNAAGSAETASTTSATSDAPPASRTTTNWFKIIVAGRRARAKPEDLSIASYWLYGVRMPTTIFEAAYEEYRKGETRDVYDSEAIKKWLVDWERDCWARKLAGMTRRH